MNRHLEREGGARVNGARIVFVTEGGPEVGLGHVSRCLAIARAARAEGARVSFLVPPEPRVAALLRGMPVEVTAYSWPDDAEGALEVLRGLGPDAIVVDSYKAAPVLLGAMRVLASPVVAVDDTAERTLPVDLVVNGGIAAESLPYARTAETTLLLGSRYALLDPDYADLPERSPADRLGRVLVTLGGGLNTADVTAAVQAADAVLIDGVVEIAAGPFAAGTRVLDDVARAARNRVVIHRDRFGLRDLMLAADLAVCGAGMTLYELAATGTPAITVCMAANQRPNAEAFARAGAAPTAGRAGDPGLGAAVEAALRRLVPAPARAEVAARAHRLVDGCGAARVAHRILEPAPARR
jgi:spore coat polysaccharide biosynthesis predicted glycosyltransferase SpsG